MSEVAVNTILGDKKTTPTPQNAGGEKRRVQKFTIWAIVSIVLVVIAWILMMFQGIAALIVAIPAVVAGFFGYKSRNAIMRYLSVTSIIAGLVLIVVMLSLITVFSIIMETI